MAELTNRTALVTGGNSGLGFDAAAQLADAGYGRVIITTRSQEKGAGARSRLVERTGKDVFDTLTLDNEDLGTVEAAADVLADRKNKIDVMLLNAGMAPPKSLSRTADGFESTVASTLIGHHLLTMRLLDRGLLADQARIVISGSEAARGDVPTFHPLDVHALAAAHFDGDLEAAIESQMRMEPPSEYKASNTYASAKQFVVWWAAELAGLLPSGITVNAVSPGSTPDTNAARNAPFYMKYLMIPAFKLIPGMSHSIADGAGRYLEAAGFGEEVNGRFFASPPKKMVGSLVEVEMDHLDNPAGQKALWNVTVAAAGGVGFPSRADERAS